MPKAPGKSRGRGRSAPATSTLPPAEVAPQAAEVQLSNVQLPHQANIGDLSQQLTAAIAPAVQGFIQQQITTHLAAVLPQPPAATQGATSQPPLPLAQPAPPQLGEFPLSPATASRDTGRGMLASPGQGTEAATQPLAPVYNSTQDPTSGLFPVCSSGLNQQPASAVGGAPGPGVRPALAAPLQPPRVTLIPADQSSHFFNQGSSQYMPPQPASAMGGASGAGLRPELVAPLQPPVGTNIQLGSSQQLHNPGSSQTMQCQPAGVGGGAPGAGLRPELGAALHHPSGNNGVVASQLQVTHADEFVGGVGTLAPMSCPIPLDYAVDDPVKETIWANHYVEFGDLLHPTCQADLAMGFKGQTMVGIPIGKKLPRTIDEWQSAFAIYASVYTQKYPSAVGPLLKYGEIVRSIARDGGNFNTYDTTFRKMRKKTPHLYPWELTNNECYLKAYKELLKGTKPSSSGAGGFKGKPRSGHNIPPGWCYGYHLGDPCNGSCGFKHTCPNCHKNHPEIKCWQRPGGQNSKPKAQVPKPQPFPAPAATKPPAAKGGSTAGGPASIGKQ